MRVLFYLVHPSKYHLFKYSINELKKRHTVDIIINSKDVLEELIKLEEWDYTNIFPKGRNVSIKPSIIKSAFKFVLTVMRLEKYLMSNKRYDVFITDDALVVNGWFRKIPTLIFNDNDIETIKINKILFYFAYRIICPETINLGRFAKKTIRFKGNKALAHLHPKYFNLVSNVLHKYGLTENNYGLIRISKINATHDIGNKGISNSDLEKLYELCIKRGNVIISTERKLDSKYNNNIFKGDPNDISSLIYYSKYFIGDSASMASEAAILGTPNILINRLGKQLSVNKALLDFGLQYYFDSFDDSYETIKEVVGGPNLKVEFRNRAKEYISKCDDFNSFMLNLILQNSGN